jgi:hypothetical protein
MGKFIDLTGHVYGRLTVLSRAENLKNITRWFCLCSCGKHTIASAFDIKSGHTTSCGCYHKEKISSQGGGYLDAEYVSWYNMVQRCTNPGHVSYVYYGALGVDVFSDWQDNFKAFSAYIGPKPTNKHSIDRVDGTKGYEPGNVRWATSLEQAANRKSTAMVDYLGVLQPLSLLARAHGLCPMLVNKRIFSSGWSVEKALTTPVKNNVRVLSARLLKD